MIEILEMTPLEFRITSEFGKIINKFPVLHHGWEGDGYGYIVGCVKHSYSDSEKYLGPFCKYRLVLTNHSKPYEADKSELKSKIIEYKSILKETSEALKLLGE